MTMDLHVHTYFSDGELSPDAAVMEAKKAGLDAIALTDHDECRALGSLRKTQGIRVYAGIELTAQHGREVHVLGLGIDFRNEALLEHIERASRARRVRMLAMIDRLYRAGIEVDMADVEAECRQSVIGRVHLAAAMVKKGYVQTVHQAFERYLAHTTPFYVPQQRIDVPQAALMISRAQGLPVLAHPGLLGAGMIDQLAPDLKKMGFWGIEAYHPAHTDGQCKEFESIARRFSLYVTSGSDYHGSAALVKIGGEKRDSGYLQKSQKEIARRLSDIMLC